MFVQILDIDYFLNNGKPVIRIFCKDENGNPLCCLKNDFLPYFYVLKTEENMKKADALGLKYTIEKRFLPIGYQKEQTDFIKIILNDPSTVPQTKQNFNTNECFEADILFKYRFMADTGIKGMGWADIIGNRVRTTIANVPVFEIKSITPVNDPEINKRSAPLKFMCIDIESLQLDFSRQNDMKKDPIIMVALAFYPAHKNQASIVLAAKPLNGKNMQGFLDEKEMLSHLLKMIDEYDPDIITGYNINGFDLPYIIERLRKYNLSTAFGRCDKPVISRALGVVGKADAKLTSQETTVTGRVVFDTYQILRRDVNIKLYRYNLNTVAKILLGREKHDISYSEIPTLWKSDIQKLADYAENDAKLAIDLAIEKQLLDKFVEISKISGVLLQDSFGGQSVRIENMILHELKRRCMLMPLKPTPNEVEKRAAEKVKGATVLEPKKGLHTNYILVLDFQSLYPSIIKAYNVSPDSLLNNATELSENEINTSPTGARFIKKDVYEGFFPKLIRELVTTRQAAKRAMKTASDEEKRVLDAKQHALKILANSFYGYAGYVRARLFVNDVANSITGYGRDNIQKTREHIEKNFNVDVIYGDTDSLFIDSNIIDDINKAKELGETISKSASQGELFFDFEKLYKSFLILTKKRYAGWKFVPTADGWKDSIDMKGIETVRRDWCQLVSETMNSTIKIILQERDVKKATELVKGVLQDLVNNRAPLEKLTIVKGITQSLDNYKGMLPHIELARKLRKRNPREPPKVGDRIGFVIIRGSDLVSKRAEDPDFIRKMGLHIDSEYYTNNQLLPPIERILNVVGVERSELLGQGRQFTLVDMFKKPTPNETLVNCEKCYKTHRRMPLSGFCECGQRLIK
jgi:DNA polymerase I